MPLETVLEQITPPERIDVKSLVLSPSKDSGKRASQRVRELKKLPCWDTKMQAWREYCDNSQYNKEMPLENQLIGILIEPLLEKLTTIEGMDGLEKKFPSNRMTKCRLLRILIESRIDPQSARQHYEALKASDLYNHELTMWRSYTIEGTLFSSTRDYYYVNEQYISTIIESSFDKMASQKQFEELQRKIYKKKPAKDVLPLNAFIVEHHGSNNLILCQTSGIGSEAAVWEILAIAQFNIAEAKEKFEILKNEFYDKQRGAWPNLLTSSKRDRFSSDTLLLSSPQLLEVLVQQTFEKNSLSSDQHPPLPTIRKF